VQTLNVQYAQAANATSDAAVLLTAGRIVSAYLTMHLQ
jgi:hypothetical protein